MISASQEDLYAIAFRAIEAYKAKNEAAAAKRVYHDAWKRFEMCVDEDIDVSGLFVPSYERVSSNHPDFDHACRETKVEHDTYKAAKRTEYNAKRRLETAIRGMK